MSLLPQREYNDSTGSNADIDYEYDVSVAPEELTNIGDAGKVASLLRTHPDYDANVAKWEKYRDLYESNDVYRFIHKHVRESEDTFAARIKRGYFLNYCASIIDLYTSYIFRAPISRHPGDLFRECEEIYQDADFRGSTYNSFLYDASADAQTYGHVGILVDATQADDEVQTEADRKRKGIRPYLIRFAPTEILDWETDRFGRFEWIKLELGNDEARSWEQSIDSSRRVFLIWDRFHWEKWEVVYNEKGEQEARLLDHDTHDLGCVPFVVLRNIRRRTHDWFGESTIRDIADVNIAILNWSSLGDEEIVNRCLNLLTMQRDPSGDSAVNISHHNVLEYAEGANPPQYLTPGATPLQLISGWITNAKDEIYRLAKLGGTNSQKRVSEAQSGLAYAFEFNETNQALAQKADNLRQADIEIHRLIAKWHGKTFNGTIEYPDEFGVEDFLFELQILTEARTNFTSDTAIKEVEKEVAAKFFSRKPMELRNKIIQEIEAADPKSTGLLESFGTMQRFVGQGNPPPETEQDEEERPEQESDE